VTKADIVERVAEKCDITKKEAIDMVESVFSILKNTLEDGEDIKISGFGKFEVKPSGPAKAEILKQGNQ